MEKNDHRDIWVFLEEFEGKPKQVGAELLGQARRLADEIGQEVAAVIIAHDADEALEMARRYGADVYKRQGLHHACWFRSVPDRADR